MGRTATNVVGNSLATAVIAKLEDKREDNPGDAAADAPARPATGTPAVVRENQG
ncbi:hypothetical protein D3C72_2468930 [compost metagenome]